MNTTELPRLASAFATASNGMPGILDGGCGGVSLIYDAAVDRVEGIGCNGFG